MAVVALAFGGARSDREPALVRAARRLGPRAAAGSDQHHAPAWSAWHGALQPRERGRGSWVSSAGISAWFDGWLRNARELAIIAGLPADAGAVEIVLALWRQRGMASLALLRGGYALLLIDDPASCVYLARDPTGMRPLFFRHCGQQLVAASSELAVLDAAGLSYVPEPAALAAYVALRAPACGVSFLRGIDEVPAGCVVRIDPTGERRHPIELRLGQKLLRLPALDDYAQAWRSVLADASVDALARGNSAGISLSGGIDSAALAALAAQRNPGSLPLAVSWRLSTLGDADESRWIDATAQACGLRQLTIDGDDLWPLASALPWPLHPDTPLANPYRLLKQAQWRAARAAGVEVLLSGDFGDHLYPGERAWLVGAMAQQRPLPALRELVLRARQRLPWRDPGLRAAVRGLLPKRAAAEHAPPWLASAAVAALQPAAIWPPWAHDSADPARCTALLGLDAALHAAQDTGFADVEGLLIAHPYRDERVIDLALSIPIDVWNSGGVPKALTRHMLRGLLPAEVRLRPKAGSLSPLLRRGLRQREAQRVHRLLWAADAQWPVWLEHDAVSRAAHAQAPSDRDDLLLWLATSVELWLRGLAQGAPVLAFER